MADQQGVAREGAEVAAFAPELGHGEHDRGRDPPDRVAARLGRAGEELLGEHGAGAVRVGLALTHGLGVSGLHLRDEVVDEREQAVGDDRRRRAVDGQVLEP